MTESSEQVTPLRDLIAELDRIIVDLRLQQDDTAYSDANLISAEDTLRCAQTMIRRAMYYKGQQ
jgi:hypothetical protein